MLCELQKCIKIAIRGKPSSNYCDLLYLIAIKRQKNVFLLNTTTTLPHKELIKGITHRNDKHIRCILFTTDIIIIPDSFTWNL